MPPSFSLRKIQVRIVVVYLGLLLIIQALSYWFIQDSINHNARGPLNRELQTGEQVFKHLLARQAEQLNLGLQQLVGEAHFRLALAEDAREPLRTALQAHASREQAALGAITDNYFQVLASTPGTRPDFAATVQRRVRQMQSGEGGRPDQIDLVDGQPYQVVGVPVRIGDDVRWVALGVPLRETVLVELKELTGLEVGLLSRDRAGDWRLGSATLKPADWQDVLQGWRPSDHASKSDPQLNVGGTEYSGRAFSVPAAPDHTSVMALLMYPVAAALAPYDRLKQVLLLLNGLGLLAFAIGGYITARRITTPLSVLSASARRLERGDYGTAVHVHRHDEIGELAQSFETMRLAIQAREGEIRRLAYQDALTGLPNREQFRHDLRQAIARAREQQVPCAVLLMDMDRFKHVNDVLGHRFGDRVLRAVADRLRAEVLGERDVLARLGGDEFALLLQGARPQDAYPVALRILRAFERPISLDEHNVDLGAGIGIAGAPDHGLDADILLSRAEVAMYAAKQQQSGTITYHPGLDSSSEESLTMLSELRHALDHQQLRLYLQPKISLRTGDVIGAEALMRWAHPTRGIVPPMRFIPFAEQTGFVRLLTAWMLEQAAIVSRQLSLAGMPMKIAVNLSTRDLMDQDFPAKIEALLIRHEVDPQLLMLEITESAIMDDPERALVTLKRLHDMGLKLSIDDFGTGYSSLAYLKRLPVDELKIDKSFVMNMESDLQDAKIVRSTVDLAHNLGLTVVAEGVENAKSWKLLAGLSCDEAQGYLISRPMPSDQFEAWVRDWAPPDTSHEWLSTDFAAMI